MQARRLTLTADDFGRSPAVNAEVERWFRAGVLTQASLMVCEPHADDAIQIARKNPGLRIGLHLALCNGHASDGAAMTRSPTLAGLRFAFWPGARAWLRREVAAQFARFREFGLPPTYWDGHAHLHLHPVVLKITLPVAREHGFAFTRLVREPGPPALLPWIFQRLSAHAAPRLCYAGVGFSDAVFGLRKTGCIDIAEFQRALAHGGDTEIYFHPGAESSLPQPEEVAALVNRTIRPPDRTSARRN
jgi:predicted glycoside hydrolase/deacetylase ChbG (UPF0249 family)